MAEVAVALSAVAIVVSVASFYLTFRAAGVAERRQRMPVIVVARKTLPGEQGHRFELTNVGGGPALNIVMGFVEDRPRSGGPEVWFNPLHLEPIRPGQTLTVRTPASSDTMVLTCTDALAQQKYTVRASNLGTRVLEGDLLPRDWTIGAVPSMWNKLPAERWGRAIVAGRGRLSGRR